ncbi:MAG TPA: 16S rRNA (guanine(966)-N(2))-methyltransferase RsmD [Acidimicrobiales bacterium]|nr:16S rRNA (guanine(966)-N(2))-methyltransferase RsmD [Acidimicrobiales bacterium]
MRVVGGEARGRRLQAPKGTTTRPTSDFVREAVFNVLPGLVDLEGAAVADLFAGTGALGIEALSRGAARAVFVESDRRALAVLRANLAATGYEGDATVIAGDVRKALVRVGTVDVAFADPPYAFDGWDEVFAGLDAGVLVVESDRDIVPPAPWRVLTTKRYGSTVVTITSPRSPA